MCWVVAAYDVVKIVLSVIYMFCCLSFVPSELFYHTDSHRNQRFNVPVSIMMAHSWKFKWHFIRLGVLLLILVDRNSANIRIV